MQGYKKLEEIQNKDVRTEERERERQMQNTLAPRIHIPDNRIPSLLKGITS